MSSVDEILEAAGRGDYDAVAGMLDDNPALATATSPLGAQPIHAAHFGRHQRIVELLMSRGVEIDFFLAAELGFFDEVQRELASDPGLVHSFKAGSTALHNACYWGQTAVARLLLERGADVNAATRDHFLQIAPLGCAVATADVRSPSDSEEEVLRLVQLLLARGAMVNARRRDGLTALHGAAYRGLQRVVETLLAHGADRTLRGYAGEGPHAGQTAAQMAIMQGQNATARLLASAPYHSRRGDNR